MVTMNVMTVLSYIIWDVSPNLLHLERFSIRWYSLLVGLSILVGYQMMCYIAQKEAKPLKDLDILLSHIIVGFILGARLGHVLFYDLAYYAQHPLEIFLPVVFEPTFKFIGYRGLSSHGWGISILIAIYIYVNYAITTRLWPPRITIKKQRRAGQSYLWIADRLVIIVALGGCLGRIGNFMNSEIIGKPTQGQYGVLFARDVTQRIRESSDAIENVKITKSNEKLVKTDSHPPVDLTIAFRHNNLEEDTVRNFLENNII